MKINKQHLKGLIKNNLELKILAVVVAILVWLYVYQVEINLPQSVTKAVHKLRR